MDYKKYQVDATNLPYADCYSAKVVYAECVKSGNMPDDIDEYCESEANFRKSIYSEARHGEEVRLTAQFRHDAETELGITHWPDDLKAVLYDIVEGFASLEEKFGAMWNIVKFTKIYSGILHGHSPTKMPCEKPVLPLERDCR